MWKVSEYIKTNKLLSTFSNSIYGYKSFLKNCVQLEKTLNGTILVRKITFYDIIRD